MLTRPGLILLAIAVGAHAKPPQLSLESRIFPTPKFDVQLKAPEAALTFILPKNLVHLVIRPRQAPYFFAPDIEFKAPDPRDAIRRLGALGQNATTVELLCLDPHTIFDNEQLKNMTGYVMDRWWIRERATTDNKADIWCLSYFLLLSVAYGPDESADCFVPSYALRYLVDNKTVDVLVAFDCWTIRIVDGENVLDYAIDEHLEKYFRSIFAEYGLLKDDTLLQ